MRFFEHGTADPEDYRKAILQMEIEVDLNYRRRQNMRKLLITCVLSFAFSVYFSICCYYLMGSIGIIGSIIAFYFCRKKMVHYHIYFSFSCYSLKVLHTELTELYNPKAV